MTLVPGAGSIAKIAGGLVSITTSSVAKADSSPTPFRTLTQSLTGPSAEVKAHVDD